MELKRIWNQLEKLPAGKWLFTQAIAKMIPYTGSIDPFVEELRDGYARVTLKDKRGNRNHLESIHAIAIANALEFVTGLALTYIMPKTHRIILKELTIEYFKKAKGVQVAECTLPEKVSWTDHNHDQWLVSELKNADGVVTARARVCWRISKGKKQ